MRKLALTEDSIIYAIPAQASPAEISETVKACFDFANGRNGAWILLFASDYKEETDISAHISNYIGFCCDEEIKKAPMDQLSFVSKKLGENSDRMFSAIALLKE